MIEQRGDQWCLMTADGSKVLGCHPSKEAAESQERAVQAAKHMAQGELYELKNREIFATGKWNGELYTEADLDEIVRAHKELGYVPPLKKDHAKGGPAYGWVENIRRIGKKLVADFTSIGKDTHEEIQKKAWNTVSPEVYWNLERDGKKYRRALKAVALLGAEVPAVDLKPLHEAAFSSEHIKNYSIHVYELTVPEDDQAVLAQVKLYANKHYAGNVGALIDWAGDVGFTECVKSLSDKEGISDPEKVCGWLKARAREVGVSEHTQNKGDDHSQDGGKKMGEEDKNKGKGAGAPVIDLDGELKKVWEGEIKGEKEQLIKLRQDTRRELIRQKIAGLKIPAFRPFFQMIYESVGCTCHAEKGEPKLYQVNVNGEAKQVTADAAVDLFMQIMNGCAENLFKDITRQDIKKFEQAVENFEDPSQEVHQRIRQYQAEHKDVKYEQAMEIVLNADQELKKRYSGVAA